MPLGTVGSWKTTRSIGRECTAGDRRSRPVLTADRLTTPIRSPRRRGAARTIGGTHPDDASPTWGPPHREEAVARLQGGLHAGPPHLDPPDSLPNDRD